MPTYDQASKNPKQSADLDKEHSVPIRVIRTPEASIPSSASLFEAIEIAIEPISLSNTLSLPHRRVLNLQPNTLWCLFTTPTTDVTLSKSKR